MLNHLANALEILLCGLTLRCRCHTVSGFLLVVSIVILILAFTVFKAKQPRTKHFSAALDGISPHNLFPVVNIQLNITLDLRLFVENPNHASFKHSPGKSLLWCPGSQFGRLTLHQSYVPEAFMKHADVTSECQFAIAVWP
ncbi:hypothetical protein V6N13_065037 [Hibiscus sabdariffa]